MSNLFWVCVIVLPSFVQPRNLAPTGLNSTYHLIDASLVKMMAESYRDNYINTYFKKKPSAMDNTNGKFNNIDSRTIWFSKEKLTEFIADMDIEAAKNNSSVSGIRFYYVKYPDATNWSKYKYLTDPAMMPSNYKERHSLVLVPTYLDNTTQYHMDFDPRKVDNTGKFKDMPTVMDELIRSEETAIDLSQIQTFNRENKDKLKIPLLLPQLKQRPMDTNYSGMNPCSDMKAAMLSGDDTGSDLSVTNGGGIIPPYSGANSASMAVRGRGNNDVPCSGATLMLYIDGFKKCGTQPIPDKQLQLKN